MTTVALVSHSTKPRGGLVHTLSLAEALHRRGFGVHLIALGDPSVGLFRPTEVPHTVLASPTKAGTTLTDRVFASIDTLAEGLSDLVGDFDIFHAQDCIAARAAARVRDAGGAGSTGRIPLIRTVHHVDDFTTQALVDCQRLAIEEPDRVLVVSEQWRGILRDDYGRTTEVVPNGVDPDRFPRPPDTECAALRARIGAGADTFVFLAVGGVEPRKGTVHSFRALSLLRRAGIKATLAVVGGHSFQDYTAYRDASLALLPQLDLTLGEDVVLLGTVSESELAGWYHAADALAFPSIKEGWGLAVLEAMSTGLPVIASDLPVFEEYLVDGQNALLPTVGDEHALAAAMRALIDDAELRDRLRAGGSELLPRFSWDASAQRHEDIYRDVRASVGSSR
ncbi:MAG TPA: MSMEG_0565 family glycosyltransferase [Pseudonocardia sp.]|nr:MSMEG_0565 family glycosyltransferase [Pseudonocardia sp.]